MISYGICLSLSDLFYLAVVAYLSSWRKQWHPTPVLLPGKSHGRRRQVGCSPWGCEESDTTERLHFHSSLSWIGEGNGNPLQCSYLENLRDGGAWWAAVYEVAQSQTWLKQLSSSSSSILILRRLKLAEDLLTDKPQIWDSMEKVWPWLFECQRKQRICPNRGC